MCCAQKSRSRVIEFYSLCEGGSCCQTSKDGHLKKMHFGGYVVDVSTSDCGLNKTSV